MSDKVDLDGTVVSAGSAAGLTREQLLRCAAAGGAVLALPGLVDTALAATRRRSAGAPQRGGVLKMARNEEAQSFDPTVPGDNGSIYTIQQIYDQLTRIDRNSTYVAPSLAQSWTISPDRKTYTFH